MPIYYDGSHGGSQQPLMKYQLEEIEEMRKHPLQAKRIIAKSYKPPISAYETKLGPVKLTKDEKKNKKENEEPLLFDITENPDAYYQYLQSNKSNKENINKQIYHEQIKNKKCTKCGKTKPIEEFSTNKHTGEYFKLCDNCRTVSRNSTNRLRKLKYEAARKARKNED